METPSGISVQMLLLVVFFLICSAFLQVESRAPFMLKGHSSSQKLLQLQNFSGSLSSCSPPPIYSSPTYYSPAPASSPTYDHSPNSPLYSSPYSSPTYYSPSPYYMSPVHEYSPPSPGTIIYSPSPVYSSPIMNSPTYQSPYINSPVQYTSPPASPTSNNCNPASPAGYNSNSPSPIYASPAAPYDNYSPSSLSPSGGGY